MMPYWFAFTLMVATALEPSFAVAFGLFLLFWWLAAKWFDG